VSQTVGTAAGEDPPESPVLNIKIERLPNPAAALFCCAAHGRYEKASPVEPGRQKDTVSELLQALSGSNSHGHGHAPFPVGQGPPGAPMDQNARGK